MLSNFGSCVAAGVQSSADWQADVLGHTHKFVMEVQNVTLEEMVPVSPRPFTALQTAVAGRLFAALADICCARWLCILIPTELTAIRGRGDQLGKQQAGAPLY